MAVGTRWGVQALNAVLVILILLGITVGILRGAHHDGYLVGKEHGYTGEKD